MTAWKKVGIIAGAGALPTELINACLKKSFPFFVIRLSAIADETLNKFPGVDCGIGQAGKILDSLRASNCDAVVLAGVVKRPNFSSLNLDAFGARLLPGIIAAAVRGDGYILNSLSRIIEKEGFRLIGANDITDNLVAPTGVIGKHKPSMQNMMDIKKGHALISTLGKFDVGQGAIVANGYVLAVEAAEGTDNMLKRSALLPNDVSECGVLVKIPKPHQDLRIDLPTIGPETISNAKQARLSGIAVKSHQTLIIDQLETINLADEANIFIYGITTDGLKE
ncbi:LpxI family protein [Hyphococcus sp.]|uniref:LpxI family protein n=1 Tax=Hyphococcus sp. TaxID=2038636 RepID=UPI003CCBB9AD